MPWWGWIVVGVVLLAAELLAIEAQFYLVLLGVAALLTGLGVAVVCRDSHTPSGGCLWCWRLC